MPPVDWPTWSNNGWMDEFVPQAYRMDYAAFEPTWTEQVRYAGERRGDLIAGIRVVGSGPDTTWDDMVRKLDLTRKTDTGGHVHWFSRAVLDVYPQQTKAYYGGFAPHPKRSASWRPPSSRRSTRT